MTIAIAPASSATERKQLPVLGVEDLRKKLKKGSRVLWVDMTQQRDSGGSVESGEVLFINGDSVDLIWLEGYKSRNDTVKVDEILSIYDPKAPHRVGISVFSGTGYITQAGVERLKANPAEGSIFIEAD